MKRFVMDELIKWKNKKNRKPLILQGARQVGKTWLMIEFGKAYYKDYIYIQFMDNPKIASIFNKDSNVKRIITDLETEFNKEITTDTLLIFDEIQEVPKALSSLKRFCEDQPQYHIICAGSLMGLALHQGTNYPVGKVDLLDVYPMTFNEFLVALDMERFVDILKDHNFDMISTFKSRYIDALKKYYIIGGMPAAVQSFIEDNDFQTVRDIQNSILQAYESDFSKHAPNDQVPKIRNVWNNIPLQLSRDSKKFIYKNLGNGARARDYEYALMWMSDCALITTVNRVTAPSVPLKFYYDIKAFKVYLNDVGLLSNMCQVDPRDILDNNKVLIEFKGALTEQFVCQELKAFNDFDFAYYTNEKNTCEVDFLAKLDIDITPIEAKAEINLQAKSLKTYMEKFKPQVGVRLSLADYKVTGNLIDLPLFAISEIKNVVENYNENKL